MKKALWFIAIFAVLLVSANGRETARLTIINKSGMDIAIQLRTPSRVCATSSDIIQGLFYYLSVPEGDKELPTVKSFDIEKETYGMQLFYIQTYDPVYGFKCTQPTPNRLMASRNLRLVVLPCDEVPNAVGEPSMRKFVPYPVKELFFFSKYYVYRFIY